MNSFPTNAGIVNCLFLGISCYEFECSVYTVFRSLDFTSLFPVFQLSYSFYLFSHNVPDLGDWGSCWYRHPIQDWDLTVIYSGNFDELWIYALMIAYYRKKFLWLGLRTVLINAHKYKDSLSFQQNNSILGSILGPMTSPFTEFFTKLTVSGLSPLIWNKP